MSSLNFDYNVDEIRNNVMPVESDGEVIYPITFYDSFNNLEEAVKNALKRTCKICVVSDSNVSPLYLETVMEKLKNTASEVISFVFDAGESSKNLDVVRKLYEHLILAHFERRDCLVALGGGVVGDLTGFTAATYLRGIQFIQIPTTLLAQVDSSIGGKTGVDFDSYKNMVGAFHQPALVYINTDTLRTLPKRQFVSGMGEVVKYGLITDRDFYQWLKANHDEIQSLDSDKLKSMIYRACDNKRRVVEIDPEEKSVRALLNFGHTLGHAIEKYMNFACTHGECVGVGSILASMLSLRKGLISEEQLNDIRDTVTSFGCPHITGFDPEKVVDITHSDKKMSGGHIRFILLRDIGDADIFKNVTDEDMLEVLKDYAEEK